MTLNELLIKIKRYYPKASVWSDSEIISIINDEQREIFRDMQKISTDTIDTIATHGTYTLPVGCEIEFIDYVGITTDNPVIDTSIFQEYTYANENEELTGFRYYDALEGLIGIYPTPIISGHKIVLKFKIRPALMDVNNLSAKPDLNEDWHRIFIYATIMEIAGSGSNPDISTANNYTLKYNELMSRIKLAKYNNKPYPRTKIKDWSR